MPDYGIRIDIKPEQRDLDDARKFLAGSNSSKSTSSRSTTTTPRRSRRTTPKAPQGQPVGPMPSMPADIGLTNMAPYGQTPAGQALMRGIMERYRAMMNGG